MFLNAKVEIAMKLKMIVALAAVASLALCAEAAKYDVAAFVWPAYQPEPRWAELGIFNEGIGEWQNVTASFPVVG